VKLSPVRSAFTDARAIAPADPLSAARAAAIESLDDELAAFENPASQRSIDFENSVTAPFAATLG
jgi:hypothetical protein